RAQIELSGTDERTPARAVRKSLKILNEGGDVLDVSVTFENKGRFNYRTAVVMIHDGHVLLHRQPKDDYWALPGGRVSLMERSRDAAVREMQEELQIDVSINQLLWITENFFTY